jgi:hypothetical protein
MQACKRQHPWSLGLRHFSAQIAEKPVSFGDTFCVHSDGYELEGITKRSSPFDYFGLENLVSPDS